MLSLAFSSIRPFRTLAAATLMSALVFSGCGTMQKNREEADFHLRIGTSHLIRGNYPQALSELLTAENLDPKNAMIQNNLGLVYFFNDRFETALKHFDRALKTSPEFNEARNNRARTLIELTRYDLAIKDLKIVLNDLTYADPSKAWVNLGLAYFRSGDFTNAKEKFAQAMKIDRNNCLAHTLFGRSQLELSQFSEAAQSLDRAIIICKPVRYDEPYYFSGLSYYKLGKTSSAIARMEEVIHLYPEGRYASKAESLLKLMK